MIPRFRVRNVVLVVWCVALTNGLAWSLLTPAFQVPDETAHFAYVQQLAENGSRPGNPQRPEFSSEQSDIQSALGTLAIIGRPTTGAPIGAETSTDLNRRISEVERTAPRDDGGGPSTAAAQPPLFYAFSAITYRVFAWASLPVRLQAVRVLAVLFFAFAVAVIALTILEFAPRANAAALVAGLAVALSPYCAFIASGATPDTALLLVSSVVLLLLARGFARGVNERRLVVLGLVTGMGLLTKLTFIAFLPGIGIGVLLLLVRDFRCGAIKRRQVILGSGYFVVASSALPLCVLGWLLLTGQPLRPAGTAPAILPAASIPAAGLREFLTYTWQLYLPRLPFMTDQFGFSAPNETWLRGFAGRYGWLDYGVSKSFGEVALSCFYATGALALVFVTRRHLVVARYWREALVVFLCTVGLCLLIAVAGYDYKRNTGLIFEQPRYLFPIAAVYAALVAAATYACGRRVQPWLTAVAVALVATHDLSGIALTVQRYYA